MPARRTHPRHLILAALAALALALTLEAPPAAATTIAFDRGTLTFALANPTSLAFGPDGRLYVASQSDIRALTLDSTGTQVTAIETVATGQQGVLGIAFDPTAPGSPVVLYASRQNPAATDSYEGVVSTFTGPSWTRSDVITGLPSSAPHTNHFTNGLAFDGTGLLYIAQGSNSDAGLPSPYYPETPLSAGILVADVNDPGFDGALTYNPATTPVDDNVDQTGGDVSVYAAGTRNAYDLVVHTNGKIYATDNGPGASQTSTSCTTSGGGVVANDELNLIEQGNYYGFPNRNRGRTDARQCVYHAPSEGSGADFTGPIATLPAHCSCDGIVEYTAASFAGAMEHDLVFAMFIAGEVARADHSPDGQSVISVTTLASGFSNPLDVTTNATGTIYVAEYGGGTVEYLTPQAKFVGGVTELPGVSTATGRSIGMWALLLALPALAAFLLLRRLRQP